MLRQSKYSVLYILIILALAIVVGAYFIFAKNPPNDLDYQRFTSDELGISFLYPEYMTLVEKNHGTEYYSIFIRYPVDIPCDQEGFVFIDGVCYQLERTISISRLGRKAIPESIVTLDELKEWQTTHDSPPFIKEFETKNGYPVMLFEDLGIVGSGYEYYIQVGDEILDVRGEWEEVEVDNLVNSIRLK